MHEVSVVARISQYFKNVGVLLKESQDVELEAGRWKKGGAGMLLRINRTLQLSLIKSELLAA